ncbi:MAG: nucleotidyltransferase domain-containing protein [candidate division NC10 bacterium]|nr:nucleotidyltransferase domain-containing protein [candidate division NC10 bacterium]
MEQLLTGFVGDVRELYGEDLQAVLLYGSAAAGEHVPGRSDINVVVVLRKLTPAQLRKAAGHLRSWHRRGFATPLFFDPEILHASLDVFPIEFLDMQERHRMLWGSDLLADLVIARSNLRLQCEQELRGKLMKLRQSYVESAHAPGELERILMAAASSIAVLARTLLRLGGGDPGGGAEAVLERTEGRFGAGTASLRKAWQLKRGAIRLTGSSLEELYQGVLQEVEGLVQVVDGLAA